MPAKNRPTVLYYPSFVYDFMQSVMFPLNYAIGAACHLQPKKSVWGEADFASKCLERAERSSPSRATSWPDVTSPTTKVTSCVSTTPCPP